MRIALRCGLCSAARLREIDVRGESAVAGHFLPDEMKPVRGAPQIRAGGSKRVGLRAAAKVAVPGGVTAPTSAWPSKRPRLCARAGKGSRIAITRSVRSWVERRFIDGLSFHPGKPGWLRQRSGESSRSLTFIPLNQRDAFHLVAVERLCVPADPDHDFGC